MVEMFMDVLQDGPIPSGICEILITLISKVQGTEYISQSRPISLCNVTYKAITKGHCESYEKGYAFSNFS